MAYSIRLPDGTLVEDIPDEVTPEAAKAQILRSRPDLMKQETPERTYGEAATDIGAKLVSGLGSLIQQPGQLAGLATGAIKEKDFGTTGLQGVGKEMQEWAKERTSKALLAKEAETARLAAEAEKTGGQWAAFKAQAGSMLSDPAQLTAFLAEQTPQAIPSIIAALIPGAGPAISAELRAAQVAAKSATTVAAREAAELAVADALKKATASQVARGATAAKSVGAVQQGVDIGGGSYEEIYKKLIEGGASESDAANQALNLARAAGVGGGALSLLAAKLPGAQAFERALAGERIGAKGILGRAGAIGAGALKEIPGEEIEEVGGKFLQNLAMQQVSPEQSLTAGLGVTAAQAAIGAAGMGGVGGALSGRQAPETETPATDRPKEPLLALGSEGAFTPVALPDGSVAMTREELAQYEDQQFQKKYAAQEADKPAQEILALGDQGVFRPTPLPDGSVAMTREDLAAYEEQQFRQKYEPQEVERPASPEPYVKPPSISGTKPEALLGEPKDALSSAVIARREAAEQKSEVPLVDDYAFLQREKQRLLQQDQTPDTKSLLGRIDDRIGEVLKRDIERRRADAEAAKTSVFAQKELPPVESRNVVVGGEELAKLQVPERFPDAAIDRKEKQSLARMEKMREQPAPPESDSDAKIAELEKERSKIKSTNLYGELIGKIAPGDVSDISPDIGKNLRVKGGRGGAMLSDIVSSGTLDNYLPPDKRPGSITFDEQEATEYIKDKLRNKDHLTFDAGIQARQLDDQISKMRQEANTPRMAEYEMSEVEPGEAASVERSAGEQAVGEATDIRYQRSTTGGKSIGKQQTQSVVDAVKSQWANAPEVVVAESMDDPAIPEAVRAHNKAAMQGGAKGSPRGFFYKGKAYVMADAATSSTQVIETLFHESLGHYGLRGTFGPEMGKVLADVVKNRRADVEAKAKEYGLDVNSEKDMLEAAEEVLAEMAQTKPGLSFVKRAIAVIRNFLRDLGLPFKMSNEDIIQKYILPARAFVERGERRKVEGAPAAMREPAKAPSTASAAFKKWFGNSKVVDSEAAKSQADSIARANEKVEFDKSRLEKLADSHPLQKVVRKSLEKHQAELQEAKASAKQIQPLVVYHGGGPNITEFRRSSGGRAIWAAEAPVANTYAGSNAGATVYPVHLRIENPLVIDAGGRTWQELVFEGERVSTDGLADIAEDRGYDGLIIRNLRDEDSDDGGDTPATHYAVFDPTQVKSATGNIGTYDPENADIRYQREAKSNPNQAAQANLDILDATGMQLQPPEPGRLQKAKDELKAITKDSAKSYFRKLKDKMEVAAFSGDAAFNNDIQRNLQKDLEENKDVIGMLLEASQSQAVNADAVAARFIIDGGAIPEEDTKKWVSVKRENNGIKLAQTVEKVAKQYGLSKEQTEQVAHTYFIAKRFKNLLKEQNARDTETDRLKSELEKENANIKRYEKEGDFEKLRTSERAKNDIKADIAKLDKAKVLITEDQRAMIEPGMSLVKNMPELEDIVDVWQGIRENAREALIAGGLWSKEYAEKMLDNAAYVPFFREEQLEEGGGPQEFMRGFQVKAAEFKLKGSNSPVNDVFDNMIRWAEYSISRSIRNHKALQMIDVATKLEVGDRKMAEKVKQMDPKKNTVRVFRNGKQEIYSLADPLYVDAFASMSNVAIPAIKWLTPLANLLRQSVVLYPLFSLAQVPQDAFSAMFTSGLKTRYALRIPVLAVKEFLKTLTKTSATHNLLKTYGATGVRDFNAAVARNDIQIAAGLRAKKGLTGKGFEFLSNVAMAADNSIRQAVYEASMQQGLSKKEALEKAFDIINFRRRGTSKLINLLGQTVPFFYAYMSVQRTAYRTLTLVGISPQKREEALKTLIATSGSVMALSLIYVMLNGGDEEYEKTPTAIRDRTLNIPGTDGFRIPLRPDLFLMPKVLTEHLYHLITDTGFSDGAKLRKSIGEGLANALLSPQPIPQAIKPAFEVAINRDFFQGRPLIGQFEQQKETERQFNDNTSEFSKILGQSGLISPIAADHLVRGMFGSVGGLFLYTTNFMINSDPDVPRPELSFRDALSALPGTSGFVTKASENALKTDFYALRDEVEKVKNTYNDIKLRSPQELDQFLSDEKNIARLGLAKGTEKIGMQLSKIRRAINQITNAPEDLYSASEKKDAIKELREVEKEMLKSVDIPSLRKMAMM